MIEFIAVWKAKLLDAVRRPIHKARQKLEGLWLIGTLFKCLPKTFWGAFYELLHGLIFATMPFWLGALILTAFVPPPANLSQYDLWGFWVDHYWKNAVSTFSHGELLVFSISLLSPTLWLATHEPDGADPLPHRRPVSTLAVVVIIIGAVLFALLKAGGPLNFNFIFWISVFLTIMAFCLRYLVLVYHGYRIPPVSESDFRKPMEDWMRDVDTHRRAGS